MCVCTSLHKMKSCMWVQCHGCVQWPTQRLKIYTPLRQLWAVCAKAITVDEVLQILLCSNLDGDKRLSTSLRVARIRPKSRTSYAMLASLTCGTKHSHQTRIAPPLKSSGMSAVQLDSVYRPFAEGRGNHLVLIKVWVARGWQSVHGLYPRLGTRLCCAIPGTVAGENGYAKARALHQAHTHLASGWQTVVVKRPQHLCIYSELNQKINSIIPQSNTPTRVASPGHDPISRAPIVSKDMLKLTTWNCWGLNNAVPYVNSQRFQYYFSLRALALAFQSESAAGHPPWLHWYGQGRWMTAQEFGPPSRLRRSGYHLEKNPSISHLLPLTSLIVSALSNFNQGLTPRLSLVFTYRALNSLNT